MTNVLLPLLLLAGPVMMIFMMRGMPQQEVALPPVLQGDPGDRWLRRP